MLDADKPLRRWSRRAWLGLGAAWLLGTASEGASAAGRAQRPARLTVQVLGLDNDRGRVAAAIFDDADAFPDQRRALQGHVVPIDKRTATIVFTGLKPGRYAVAVLHDENENDKMDFNWVGMPLEGYGFSRDASALFGPPSFEEAAVTLSAPSRIWIKARYFKL